MNDNENSVAFCTGKTEGGRTNLEFHDSNKKHLFPENTTGTGYTRIFDNDSDNDSNDAFESRWLITLQRWITACRIVAFVFSLVAFCLISLETRTSMVLVYNENDDGTSEDFTFNCKDSFPIIFFKYVNLAVCAYALLLLLVSAFVRGRKGTGETVPASVLWTTFFLNIFAISFLLLAFAASMAVEVQNRIRKKKFCNVDYDGSAIDCFRIGAYCKNLEIALAASLLVCASFMAGTYIGRYCFNHRSPTSPDLDGYSSVGVKPQRIDMI